MLRGCLLAVLICVLIGATTPAPSQQIHLPPAVSQSQTMDQVPVTGRDDIQKQQAQAANLQRQVEIKRDTEKMLALTQELKDDLLKSDQGSVMSLDAIKKAEQIEKLAHSVKSKMKQSL